MRKVGVVDTHEPRLSGEGKFSVEGSVTRTEKSRQNSRGCLHVKTMAEPMSAAERGLADELDGLQGFEDAEPEGGGGEKRRKDKKNKKTIGLSSKGNGDDDGYGDFDISRDSGSGIPRNSGNRGGSSRGAQGAGGPRWNTSGVGARASNDICSLQDQTDQRRYGFPSEQGRASFRG